MQANGVLLRGLDVAAESCHALLAIDSGRGQAGAVSLERQCVPS